MLLTWKFEWGLVMRRTMFATAQVDLFFIKLILHLSHIKHMYNQTAHLSEEQIICVQIVIRRVDFDTDSTVKNYQACSSTQ